MVTENSIIAFARPAFNSVFIAFELIIKEKRNTKEKRRIIFFVAGVYKKSYLSWSRVDGSPLFLAQWLVDN